MENRPDPARELPTSAPSPAQPDFPADWSTPQPAVLPRPTVAPAGVAFGATFLLWGLLTSYLVSIVGLLVFAASLTLWIREILLEHTREQRHERR